MDPDRLEERVLTLRQRNARRPQKRTEVAVERAGTNILDFAPQKDPEPCKNIQPSSLHDLANQLRRQA